MKMNTHLVITTINTSNKPHLFLIKDVMQSHPLCRMHFGQYKASLPALGWLEDGDCTECSQVAKRLIDAPWNTVSLCNCPLCSCLSFEDHSDCNCHMLLMCKHMHGCTHTKVLEVLEVLMDAIPDLNSRFLGWYGLRVCEFSMYRWWMQLVAHLELKLWTAHMLLGNMHPILLSNLC